MKIKLQTSSKIYYSKPKNISGEYKKISFLFREDRTTEKSIETVNDLKNLIKKSGAIKPWTVFSNESSIVMIDFDKGLTAREALSKSKIIGLLPTLAYKTLSETFTGSDRSKITRFRFVYLLDEKITSRSEFESFTKMLRTSFPECDKSTFNYNRWFFTGPHHDPHFIFYDGEISSKKSFVLKIASTFILSSTPKVVERECEKVECYSEIKKCSPISCNSLCNSCLLFKDLNNGNSISHLEKVLLLSNLNNVEGGNELFLSALVTGKNTKDKSKWKSITNFIEHKKYVDIKCNFACRYAAECKMFEQYGSLYNMVSNKAYPIADSEKTIPLTEARKKLSQFLSNDVFERRTNTVYLYKVPAGVGKTHTIMNNFINFGITAFPNHQLMREKSEELMRQGVRISSTKDLKEFLTNPKDFEQACSYYSSGNIAAANNIIKSYPGGVEYIKKKNIPLSNRMFTTHEKTFLAAYDEGCKVIFYDEDPTVSVMFQYKKYNLSSIEKDFSHICEKGIITVGERALLVKFLHNIRDKHHNKPRSYRFGAGKVKSTIESVRDRIKEYQKKDFLKIKNNLVAFLSAESYSHNSYVNLRKFPKGKSIFILSATPDIDLIKKIAADSGMIVKERIIPQVERLGKLDQFIVNTSRSAFRRDAQKITNNIDKGKVTITYKEFTTGLNPTNQFIPYGGNSLGYNSLKGLDINVAHTYQCPPDVYFHKFSYLYGKPVNDTKMSLQYVDWYGKRFLFFAYNNKLLRDIVFHHIDSEMVQALERSRTITENTRSTVYSSFICSVIAQSSCKFV